MRRLDGRFQEKHGESIKGAVSGRYAMLAAARQRACHRNLPFDLKLQDLPKQMPVTCPILGIPMFRSRRVTKNSPSLDRINPELGYTKGNVRIISSRANHLRSNASSDEITAILNDATVIEQQEVDSYCLS